MSMEGGMGEVFALQAHCARKTPPATKGRTRHKKNLFFILVSWHLVLRNASKPRDRARAADALRHRQPRRPRARRGPGTAAAPRRAASPSRPRGPWPRRTATRRPRCRPRPACRRGSGRVVARPRRGRRRCPGAGCGGPCPDGYLTAPEHARQAAVTKRALARAIAPDERPTRRRGRRTTEESPYDACALHTSAGGDGSAQRRTTCHRMGRPAAQPRRAEPKPRHGQPSAVAAARRAARGSLGRSTGSRR